MLQPLALWMHEQKEGEEGERVAHRDEIKAVIAPHLARIGLKGEDAKGFLDSIRDRSGLLVERALDVFGFQHQTFQEYLTAREIAERGRTNLLVSHFGDAYWREVTLLCAGIRDASHLLRGILFLSDERLMEHRKLLIQILDETLFVDEKTREAVVAWLESKKLSVKLKTGGGMLVDIPSQFILSVTNHALEPINEVNIELFPSADYEIESEKSISLRSLLPEVPREASFIIRPHVPLQITVNMTVNGQLYTPPVRIFAIRDNPYVYGPPIDNPTAFFGRKKELEDIFQAVTKPNKQDILLVGERRSGKTSLFYQIQRRLQPPYIPVYVIVNQASADIVGVIKLIVRKIIESLVEYDILPADPLSRYQCTEEGLTDNLKTVFDVARGKLPEVKIVLLADEGDYLLKIDDRLQNLLRAALQSREVGSCLRAVFAGTSVMRTYVAQSSSPFFNHFRFVSLRPLSSTETEELITEPAKTLGYFYDQEAIDDILLACGGHPYYCQRICYEAFDLALKQGQTVIDERLAKQAIQTVIESPADDAFEGFRTYFWDTASSQEREFMGRLAESKVAEIKSRTTVDRLIDWQIVMEKNGTFEFTALLFREWVKRLTRRS